MRGMHRGMSGESKAGAGICVSGMYQMRKVCGCVSGELPALWKKGLEIKAAPTGHRVWWLPEQLFYPIVSEI